MLPALWVAKTGLSAQDTNLTVISNNLANVSTTGFMAECAEPVRIGSRVSLEVPGIGEVEAQVRWQLGGRMGGMFLDPISLSRCEWTATPVSPEPQAEPV